MSREVKVPNIGDFDAVEIIDVHVKPGDTVKLEDALITLESDKATMDIPAEAAGKIKSVKVKAGDRISEGDLILILEEQEEQGGQEESEEEIQPQQKTGTGSKPDRKQDDEDSRQEDEKQKQDRTASAPSGEEKADLQADVVVLGSGPGGYTAAFRAADLGLKVILVERYPSIGGVCLNVGCIPSKALLHVAKVIAESREAEEFGIAFGKPEIDRKKLAAWKDKVVSQLTNGLKGLARQRKVTIVQGTGKFTSPNRLHVSSDDGEKSIAFDKAIIGAGSQAVKLPFLPDDPRILDSTSALELESIPKRLLVIGGGIIGLELATVYHELGVKITVVEMLDRLMAGADADIVKPLQKRISGQYENIFTGSKVTAVKAEKKGLMVTFEGGKAPDTDTFDAILVAAGRKPNGLNIGADAAGVKVDEQGFIPVDSQKRTNVENIFAIGDIVGEPMLAHKANHEGKVAAEVCAGEKRHFVARVIPSVAYTDPEVAWAGVTEAEAKSQGLDYGKGVFPWAASGRSLSLGRSEGVTKLIFDNQTRQIIGAGIVGPNAGDLIAEVALAIEMNCEAEDIGLTVHPHPTLSETVAFAAEMFDGTITDLYIPKKK